MGWMSWSVSWPKPMGRIAGAMPLTGRLCRFTTVTGQRGNGAVLRRGWMRRLRGRAIVYRVPRPVLIYRLIIPVVGIVPVVLVIMLCRCRLIWLAVLVSWRWLRGARCSRFSWRLMGRCWADYRVRTRLSSAVLLGVARGLRRKGWLVFWSTRW